MTGAVTKALPTEISESANSMQVLKPFYSHGSASPVVLLSRNACAKFAASSSDRRTTCHRRSTYTSWDLALRFTQL